MFERHHHTSSPLMQSYLERLHAHMVLTANLREGLLETLGRADAPPTLQGWITDTLEQNRLQGRYIIQVLRQHGEKRHDEHETVSTVLNTMISCFPGEAPLHILSAVLNLAGDIARQRTSLALLSVLAEKLHLTEERNQLSIFKEQSKILAQKLRNTLPSLLDHASGLS